VIAVSSSGSRFGALAQYLAHGRGPEHVIDRVDWVASRNLMTDDPIVGARLMHATAAANDRVQAPVYHLVVSFHPDDVVNQLQMERVADRLLAELKLTEHQVLIVAHRDREHPHMHLMVNRVHPETGRAWDRWKDWSITQRVLRQEERALRLVQTRGRLHALDGPELPERARTTSGELRQQARSGVEPLVERVRQYAPELRTADTWDDLHGRLAAHDLRVERKGQGLVITDGAHEVKASRVHRELSFASLEHRLGAFRGADQALSLAPERAVTPVPSLTRSHLDDVADQLRTHGRANELSGVAYRASQEVSRAETRLEDLQWAASRYRAVDQDFGRVLGHMFIDPELARERFDRAVRLDGRNAALNRLTVEPHTYGALRQTERKMLWGLVSRSEDHDARGRAPDATYRARDMFRAADSLQERLDRIAPDGTRWTLTDFDRAAAHIGRDVHRTQATAREVQQLQRELRPGLMLDRELGRMILALAPDELRRLATLVTAPEYALVTELTRIARQLVIGREIAM
jgi:hypothetical protein